MTGQPSVRLAQAPRGQRLAVMAGSYIRRRDGVSVYIENLLLALVDELAAGGRAVTIDVIGCRRPLAALRRVLTRHRDGATIRSHLRFLPVAGEGPAARIGGCALRAWRSGPYDLTLLPNLQPLPLRGRTLSILHDLTYQVARAHFSRRRYQYMDWLTRMRLRRDDAVAAISQTTRLHLLEHYPASRQRPTLLLPNGMPETKLAAPPSTGQRHAAVTAEHLQLVFCGRLNRLKGVDRVLRLAEALDAECQQRGIPSITVHLVGKATAETEPLLANTRFARLRLRRHGFLSDAELNRLYTEAGFALFLSRNEGFGLPLVEAMWMGALPLVSDIPIFAEVLGAAYPRFTDTPWGLRAMLDTIQRARRDADYRERLFAQLDQVIAHHRDGYRRSARAVLEFMAEQSAGAPAPVARGAQAESATRTNVP